MSMTNVARWYELICDHKPSQRYSGTNVLAVENRYKTNLIHLTYMPQQMNKWLFIIKWITCKHKNFKYKKARNKISALQCTPIIISCLPLSFSVKITKYHDLTHLRTISKFDFHFIMNIIDTKEKSLISTTLLIQIKCHFIKEWDDE